MSIDRHVILNHVDTPVRFLFWTKGEITIFLGPVFVGLFFDQVVFGLVVSALSYCFVGHYKKRFGKGQLQAVLYWYFPQHLKGFPMSYIREYVG